MKPHEERAQDDPPIIDGGPAFPVIHESKDSYSTLLYGMTLRDYFAAQAMAGSSAIESVIGITGDQFDLLATAYYRMADAMLKAREK